MVDAYQDITIPFQMSSVEFFTLVKEHLVDGGVMVVNMNMRGSGEGSINEYLCDTIASVFSTVYKVDVAFSGNTEVFASDNEDMMVTMAGNALSEKDSDLFLMMAKRVGEYLEEYEGGDLIMTDDKAPVELLGMKVIDEMIQDEVSYYKEIYKERGLSGIMEILR